MRRLALTWTAALALVASLLLLQPATGRADIDEKVKASLAKIAAAIEKGDADGAKSQAAALAKKLDDLNEVMYGFRPRKAKLNPGLGVGSKPGVVQPDGIELKLNAIGRDGITKAELDKEAEALVEAAWMTAAICEVAIAKAPLKDMGKKKKDKWIEWSAGGRDAAKALAAAAKARDIQGVKEAAVKVNNNCNSCHMIFR